MSQPPAAETELYLPVKRFLERQGYSVKGEIGDADVLATRGEEAPLIVELKRGFSLSLFHQAIDRQTVSDAVYIAVPHKTGRAFAAATKKNKTLCRRLGLGLLTVRLASGAVVIVTEPGPYRPRMNLRKQRRLQKEFERRAGDPSAGGSTRQGLITAYRQDALRCLAWLQRSGPSRGRDIAAASGVKGATRIMADDHYGWFKRVRRGVYEITPGGVEALSVYASAIVELESLTLVTGGCLGMG